MRKGPGEETRVPNTVPKQLVVESTPEPGRSGPLTRIKDAETRTEQAETRIERNETESEQALRASELSYRRLFEAARDGILILDVDTGRISEVNPFLVELLGFSHAEMVGELSPFKDIESNKVMLERLQKDGKEAKNWGRQDILRNQTKRKNFLARFGRH
jgi:PAS domain S-box-containing protein